MANIFFCADLHLGHKNILTFSGGMRPYKTVEEHDKALIENWNYRVRKKDDLVWVLGDVAWSKERLYLLNHANGRKILVRGNHDTLPIQDYLNIFEEVYGIYAKYGYWITHAPIHEQELRGRPNIHGHTHTVIVPDKRYMCVSMEQIGCTPISLDEIRTKWKVREHQP